HSAAAPLKAGATFAHTAVADELGNLFAAADPLLKQIDTKDLSTVLSTLSQASSGEGPTIRASITEGAKLAAFLDQTLPAQLQALDSFSNFTTVIAPTGASLNALAAASNRALPAFNKQSAAYSRLLAELAPFADNLAQFLAAYHPNIETLLNSGDDVARVVLVRQADIGNLIKGLGIYLTKFAHASDPAEVLPNGSRFGYFQTFIMLSDLNQLVCGLLAPPVPNMSFLAPLQQVLTGAGTPFNCSSQMAAFNAAQQAPQQAVPAAALATPNQAASSLSTQMYQQLTAPRPAPQPAGNPLQQLLGGLLG
ncbi:MAG TPA: MCE family protein, partial [Mycobacterium sp.]|nr:MCE family protein [Mycobacterium sp.]